MTEEKAAAASQPRLLALDPSFCHTGYVVVELGGAASQDLPVAHGVIKTERSAAKRGVRAADDNVERIRLMLRELLRLVQEYGVRMIVAELPTSGGQSARAVAAMAIAQAVCASLVEATGLPAEWVTPMENKKNLAGARNAGKDEMQAAALGVFPGLHEEYLHKSGPHSGKTRAEFEHVADAVGAYAAVRSGTLVSLLRKGTGR